MDNLTTAGTSGAAGILGVIATWLGFKKDIKNLKDNVEKCQLKEVCAQIHEATNKRLESIEALQKESREDIKMILQQVKK